MTKTHPEGSIDVAACFWDLSGTAAAQSTILLATRLMASVLSRLRNKASAEAPLGSGKWRMWTEVGTCLHKAFEYEADMFFTKVVWFKVSEHNQTIWHLENTLDHD